ncbi:hypothetical protein L2E82_09063 [Cichorium intybus]|uniref:Uncharacterized protein n=1 Tax=Cichorium intybus TaxID=13427 RepID=A0ACB9G8F3_CICIN|nr:hypothetical protein L2E82_09063 [Cichorium intybus]
MSCSITESLQVYPPEFKFTSDFKCIADMAEVKHFNTSKSKKPLNIDWALLLPTDDSVDDRPPEIVITSAEKSKDRGGDLRQPEMEKEDFEYQKKTDWELEVMIPRIKANILTLGHKLSDNGEKLKATLRRCEAEVERRKRSRDYKGDTRCKETLELSDEGDDGASCGKKKSNQESSASPNFTKIFSQKLDEDNNSRTVNAFQEEFSLLNSFEERKKKQNGEVSGRGQSSFRKKQFGCPTPTTLMGKSEKQRITNADKKANHSATFRNRPASSPKAHAPKKIPQRKLRSKLVSDYYLVDEEPMVSDTTQYAEKFDDWTHAPNNQPSRKLRSRHASPYHLVDEEPLEEEIDDWSPAPHSSPSRKSRLRHVSTYCVVDEDLIPDKLDDCMQDVIVYYPSRDDQDSVEVIYRDMACLAPQVYLSSTIMNFYIRYLQQMTSSENIFGNFHFFNTYFYNKLQKLSYKEDSFVKFRKWWKGVNLFEKAYILLPVHEKAHWSLGIICFPTKEDELGPVVLHLDSLGLHDSKSIFHNIKSFVKEEWNYLQNSEDSLDLPITDKMDDRRVLVPQQRNEYDCGLFVLYYMERFIKEAPKRFKEEDLSMFSKQWFRPQEASNLRTKIHNLLVHQFNFAKQKETISSPKSC